MVWCCSGYRGNVWENGFYRGKSHPGRLSWQSLCSLYFTLSSFLSQSLVSANNWWCPPRFGVFSFLFSLFLISFKHQFSVSNLDFTAWSQLFSCICTAVCECNWAGWFWDILGICWASRGCGVFVSEAFRDNWTWNYGPICFTVHY